MNEVQELLKNAGSPLERVRILVGLNQAWISARCEQYAGDAFAWRWRQDYWNFQ